MAFKLAIIGLGKIAQDQHLPVVAKNKDFDLAAVVSSREGYRDVPHFRTPAELFRSGLKLDAVALCMPPEPRFAIARDAQELKSKTSRKIFAVYIPVIPSISPQVQACKLNCHHVFAARRHSFGIGKDQSCHRIRDH